MLQMGNGRQHTVAIAVVITPAFRSYVQSVLKDYQIVRTQFVKFAHSPDRYGAQRQTRTAPKRKIIDGNPLRAVHSHSVE